MHCKLGLAIAKHKPICVPFSHNTHVPFYLTVFGKLGHELSARTCYDAWIVTV